MVKSIGPRPRPVYVFVHILVPHGPFGFGPDGRCLSQDEQEARGDAQGYVDQVAYAGQIIDEVVTALQAPGRVRPVILIVPAYSRSARKSRQRSTDTCAAKRS